MSDLRGLVDDDRGQAAVFERLLIACALGITAIGLSLSYLSPAFFERNLAAEDGPFEILTTLALLVGSALCFGRSVQLRRERPLLFRGMLMLYAGLFLLAASKEISWGSSILRAFRQSPLGDAGSGAPEMPRLDLEGDSIQKLYFGPVVTLILVFYVLPVPLLYSAIARFRRLCAALAVPIPRARHSIAYFIFALLTVFIDSHEKWEVFEFAGSSMFLVIHLWPRNLSLFESRAAPSVNPSTNRGG